MRKLTISFVGRIPNYKNSRDIVQNRKTGRSFPLKSKQLKEVQERLKELAREKMISLWSVEMLGRGVFFELDITNFTGTWTSPDLDGIVSTILDSLQGVVFPDDRYCVHINANKVYKKDQPEMTYITIQEITDNVD